MAYPSRPLHPLPAPASWLLALVAIAPNLAGQCGSHWLPGELPGASSSVRALASWDPDGAGPLGPRLVAGGRFEAVANAASRFVAWRDGTRQWHALGAELSGDEVSTLLPLPNGDLIVGGRFRCPSVPGTYNIARWDGSGWQQLAGGMAGRVRDLALAPNGDVIAVGSFTTAGGVAANGVARWNGTSWTPLGSGIAGTWTVAVLPNGDVVAGGNFASAGGVPAASIARWDGQSWSPLGAGITAGTPPAPASVADLAVLPNGDLVVAGAFSTAGSVAARNAARWNGQSWSTMGDPYYRVNALHVLASGDVVHSTYSTNPIRIWDEAAGAWTWITGTTDGSVSALTELVGGELCVGGQFQGFDGSMAFNLAEWDGTTWSAAAPGQPPDRQITHLELMPNGDVIAVGGFTTIGGVPANGIARWDGSHWSALGTPPPLLTVLWFAMAARANGDLMITSITPGGMALLRWDGITWTVLAMVPGQPHALVELPNGDLLAGGSFTLGNLVRWDGSAWHSVGNPDGPVAKLWRLRGGDVVVGGRFTTIGGVSAPGLARWDGTSWSPIGSLTATWHDLVELPNGDLVASGTAALFGANRFTYGMARWDGSTWTPLGTGATSPAVAFTLLPSGDVIAADMLYLNGVFAPSSVMRWDGTTWYPVDNGLGPRQIKAMVQRPDGEIVLGGSFLTAGGRGSAYFARLAPDCPASTRLHGAGCVGSAGPLVLTTDTRPWLGTAFRATCDGVTAGGLTFAVFGLSTLWQPLPYSPSTGCMLLVSPLGNGPMPAAAGRATATTNIPNVPALVGATFQMQAVHLELGAGSTLQAVTSSNALEATVGAL